MPLIDDTDRQILALLTENARLPVKGLADRLGLSRTTVTARLDRLVGQGVIRKFTILTDTAESAPVRAMMMVELQGSLSRAVIRRMRAMPEIASLHSTNGAWDLVAEIRAADLRDFDRVLRLIREIPGVLNSETSLLLDSVL
ncbi:Lrp/AsnC family transcriptional regulator [Mangrovicoccus algicola]|uniref:Lrp/AsnC family transcriptional regulator n=1 Tax=Mangrovicoccus algicola TaxID=2771008 RepID=A0A8J7D1A3_9RHOB|nr:Lrp/AsnC family transcriptional regulator [Mangrovicoccus algicola]MBE3640543.1 Lrp/AsnC family transcriptional regulator [Mangrovicoccus algicola]